MSTLFSRAASVVQSAAKISADAIDRARELSLQSVSRGSSAPTNPERIRTLLESRFELEKLEGLRTVIQIVNQGDDASEYYAHVVKNAITPNVEIRRLVYSYISVYASRNPELALLSINALQRDLSDPTFATRILALRTLSSIHVASVVPLVVTALQTAGQDISPAVRRTAVLCLTKVHPLLLADDFQDLLLRFLGDRDANVVGAAVQAVEFINSSVEGLAVLHPFYRRICEVLSAMDNVCQPSVIAMLLKYVKAFMSPPKHLLFSGRPRKQGEIDAVDPDLELLWRSLAPLCSSSSPAVLWWVARVLMETATDDYKALVFETLNCLLNHDQHLEQTLLLVLQCVRVYPECFSSHFYAFYLNPYDSTEAATLKLSVLAELLTEGNCGEILSEFRHYIYTRESIFACRLVTQLARREEWLPYVCPLILELISHPSPDVVSEAIIAIKYLFMASHHSDTNRRSPTGSPETNARILRELVRMLPNAIHQGAKATLIYIYAVNIDLPVVQAVIPDTLRLLAVSFHQDSDLVRAGTLALATKVHARLYKKEAETIVVQKIQQLVDYILLLGRIDWAIDVRDKARFLTRLSGSSELSPNLPSIVYSCHDRATQSSGAQKGDSVVGSSFASNFGPWRPNRAVSPTARTPYKPPEPTSQKGPSRFGPPIRTPAQQAFLEGKNITARSRPQSPKQTPQSNTPPAPKRSNKVHQTLDEFLESSDDEVPAFLSELADHPLPTTEEDESESPEAEMQRQIEIMALQSDNDSELEGTKSLGSSPTRRTHERSLTAPILDLPDHDVWKE